MALNPYTLNHLYRNGILDYEPTDLMSGYPMGISTPMANPYLDLAKQGGLYQSHGMQTDSFHSNYTPAYTPEYPQNQAMASNSYPNTMTQNGMISGFGTDGYQNNGMPIIGSKSNAGFSSAFNGLGIGTYNNTDFGSIIGENGVIGSKTNAGGANIYGGFADTQNNINYGLEKNMSTVSQTPKPILGIIAGAIGLTAIVMAFKKGKKPAKTQSSFLSKLNPMNWFKQK